MENIERAAVVAEARTWIGTPFAHQGRLKGIGIDCVGLVVCCARALGRVAADFDVEPYPKDPRSVEVEALMDQHMIKQAPEGPLKIGQVILSSVMGRPQHLAILGDYLYGGLSVIHIFNRVRSDKVIETRYMPHTNLAFVAAYEFPGVV